MFTIHKIIPDTLEHIYKERKDIMQNVKLDFSRCKGCYLCVSVCPKGVLVPSDEIGAKGFPIVQIDDTKECIGCGACFKMCPDYCIEIEES